MMEEKLNTKLQFYCTNLLMISALLAISSSTMATMIEGNPTTLSVSGAWPTITISACRESACEAVKLPQDMLDAMHEGYSEISLNDLTRDVLPEVILTHNAEGAVNSCSRIFRYENETGTLSALDGIKNQICNYSVKNDALISRYRNGAKWYEDIYKVRNDNLYLTFSDSCVGCDYISRTIFSHGTKADSLLVTNNLDYQLRRPLSTVIATEKAVLYSEPNVKHITRMYLISGDQVSLIDESPDETISWYKVRYKTKKGKIINAWLQCGDIQFCEE